MNNKTRLLIVFCVLVMPSNGRAQQSLDAMIDSDLASLVATYKTLHAAPELSHHEEKTASFFASQLRTLGYTVTERVGKYENPEWTSYGVVAVMKNGARPTVLLRTELDALPVDEKTGGKGDDFRSVRTDEEIEDGPKSNVQGPKSRRPAR